MLYETASSMFELTVQDLQNLDNNIKNIENYLEDNQVPFTPGRGLILNWNKE